MSEGSELDCASEAGGEFVGLRVGALFAILVVSSVGALLPFFTYKLANLSRFFFLTRCFASGVVLATGYCHVLADAGEAWDNQCLYQGDYPWAFCIAAVSSIFTFTMEWFLHNWFHSRIFSQYENAREQNDDESLTSLKQEKVAAQERLDNIARSLTFEIGIIFHSIFIGISLGITSDRSTVIALMIALMFHQGCEGIALGVLFIKAGYSKLKYLILAFVFVIITPVGIAIGIGVNTSYQSNSKVALGFQAVFDSVSAGILLYNALVDLLMPCFERSQMPPQKWLQALGFGFLYFGLAVMAVIAKWA